MTYRPNSGQLPERGAIPTPYTWDLSHICRSWDEWQESYRELEQEVEAFRSRQGSLASGADALIAAILETARHERARMLIAELPADAAIGHSLTALRANGFKQEGKIPDYFRDGVALLFLRHEI